MTTRREFVASAAVSALAVALPARTRDGDREPPGFVNVTRPPDRVVVRTDARDVTLSRGPAERWSGEGGITADIEPGAGALHVRLASPTVPLRRIELRWRARIGGAPAIVGDAWERGYGDLEWRRWVPDRVMPWYFATHDRLRTHGYGVRTGCAAFCFWLADPDGVTLVADVRSGGSPLSLGQRTLGVCDVVGRAGHAGEAPFAALRALCRLMCPAPRMPAAPVYGSNDWYSVYGDNSAGTVRADAGRIVELSPAGVNRPFAVIDDGWQPGGGRDKPGAGIWDRGNEKFPDLPGLAADVTRAGARPGIWIRPLQAAADTPAAWRLSRERETLDPTVPEVRAKVAADIARLHAWGFELIKHDYSTFDLFGRWGFQMGAALTRDGWRFAEGTSRTTAEVIDQLYATIREAAGGSLLIGCNTVSHLSAGRFEICRIGDDTSGTEWGRTRRMGVNSLAFRGVQHGAFYVADPDCVGVTRAVPWSLNRQWLDLVARSGTMLSVSLAADALGAAERRDLKAALALAAEPAPLGEPLDWETALYPTRWRLRRAERRYDWTGADGAGAPG
jgi:alpha-galactosidase